MVRTGRPPRAAVRRADRGFEFAATFALHVMLGVAVLVAIVAR